VAREEGVADDGMQQVNDAEGCEGQGEEASSEAVHDERDLWPGRNPLQRFC